MKTKIIESINGGETIIFQFDGQVPAYAKVPLVTLMGLELIKDKEHRCLLELMDQIKDECLKLGVGFAGMVCSDEGIYADVPIVDEFKKRRTNENLKKKIGIKLGPTPEMKRWLDLRRQWKLFNKAQRQNDGFEMSFKQWAYNANIDISEFKNESPK